MIRAEVMVDEGSGSGFAKKRKRGLPLAARASVKFRSVEAFSARFGRHLYALFLFSAENP